MSSSRSERHVISQNHVIVVRLAVAAAGPPLPRQDGKGRATVWTCDLTHGYIDINGSYRN